MRRDSGRDQATEDRAEVKSPSRSFSFFPLLVHRSLTGEFVCFCHFGVSVSLVVVEYIEPDPHLMLLDKDVHDSSPRERC